MVKAHWGFFDREVSMKKKAYPGKLSAAALLAVFALCLAVAAGCGSGDPEQGHYYMMDVQAQEYTLPKARKTGWFAIGKQFYKDELVQFWSESESKAGEMTVNIYLSHENGSSELLLKDMPKDYRRGSYWLDQSGNLYFRISEELVKFDKKGNVLFRKNVRVTDLCQMPDGRVMLLLPGENNRGSKLAELDAETGDITEKDIALESFIDCMSADGDGLVLLDRQGVWHLDLNDGSQTCLMNFAALSYKMDGAVYAFRLPEKGRAELLKGNAVESLRMVDVSEIRKVVVFRDWNIDYTVKDQVYNFNHSNEEYYVVCEECDENTHIYDFRRQTGIELAAGKGADIIVSDAMSSEMDYIQNGMLEDLTPYIENSGIRKEDYFPAAFSHWAYDGKIYGVDLSINPASIWIDEELLGGREVPDVETLVEAMLDYKGGKKWYWPSDWILRYLLRGSEDMWGLIDRETGNCDFTGKLFSDMLKAAKMHGGSYEENASAGWAQTGFGFFDSSEKLAKEGRVKVGFLFDDGAHALANEYRTMAISSSSQNKEGAWAFIRYLLDKDIQKTGLDFYDLVYGGSFPVSREVFNEELGSFLERKAASNRNFDASVKQDILDPKRYEEVRAVLEDARFAPINNGAILSIILEEADWYFSGTKSAEEVCGIIQNRVKVYLEEQL